MPTTTNCTFWGRSGSARMTTSIPFFPTRRDVVTSKTSPIRLPISAFASSTATASSREKCATAKESRNGLDDIGTFENEREKRPQGEHHPLNLFETVSLLQSEDVRHGRTQ